MILTERNSEKKLSIEKQVRPKRRKKNEISIEELAEGICNQNRTLLAQAITLVESKSNRHIMKAQELIQKVLPFTGKSIRIGVTGVPGAGKSTFIEALGKLLCEQGNRVAVLAVDPSSTITGGSILADKTRMETLATNKHAFIRPTPSRGQLGGVGRNTRETILLCEAAGYNIILIETVGVGQSEVVVRSMVDCFLLLVLTGAGDELQTLKKGVIELSDIIVVNKADGSNKQTAQFTAKDYNQILHYLTPVTTGWTPKAVTASALFNEGIEGVWGLIKTFSKDTKSSGFFEKRRHSQMKEWIYSAIRDSLEMNFFANRTIKAHLPMIEKNVVNGIQPVTLAVKELIDLYLNEK